MVDFGICLIPDEAPYETLESLKFVERGGFKYAWIVDSNIPARELWAMMGACALSTSTIKLGTGVTNPVTRHPTVTASAISTVNELSKGRAVLGIGLGDTAVFNIGLKPSRISEFREAVRLIRRLTAGESVSYHGRDIKLVAATRPVPIYVCGTSPRTLQVAGQVADGVLIAVGVHEDFYKYAIENIRKGAEEAGRNLEDIDLVRWIACVTLEDGRKARDEMKPYPAAFLSGKFALGMMKAFSYYENLGLGKEYVMRMGKEFDPMKEFDYESSASKLVRDDLIDAFGVAGTPKEVVGKLKAVAATKPAPSQIILSTSWAGKDEKTVLKHLTEKVMPQFA